MAEQQHQVQVVARGDSWLTWRRAADGLLECRSHALRDDSGGVWLVDPLDGSGLDDLLGQLGDVAGVIVLLDRHLRDAPQIARRHGTQLWFPAGRSRNRPPEDARRYDSSIDGTPFEFLPIRRKRSWNERALWWPAEQTLVTADALGTARYFLADPHDAIAVHPLLRLGPPRSLKGVAPRRVLVGHGDPLEGAPDAAPRAVRGARRGIARYALSLPRHMLRVVRAPGDGPRSGC